MSETRDGQRYYDTGDKSECMGSAIEMYKELADLRYRQLKHLSEINKKLNAVIKKYAWHKKDCMLFSIAERPHCTCGFESSVKDLENKPS